MSERVVHLKCDYCYTTLDGPEAEEADAVWLHVLVGDREWNFCDMACAIAEGDHVIDEEETDAY